MHICCDCCSTCSSPEPCPQPLRLIPHGLASSSLLKKKNMFKLPFLRRRFQTTYYGGPLSYPPPPGSLPLKCSCRVLGVYAAHSPPLSCRWPVLRERYRSCHWLSHVQYTSWVASDTCCRGEQMLLTQFVSFVILRKHVTLLILSIKPWWERLT